MFIPSHLREHVYLSLAHLWRFGFSIKGYFVESIKADHNRIHTSYLYNICTVDKTRGGGGGSKWGGVGVIFCLIQFPVLIEVVLGNANVACHNEIVSNVTSLKPNERIIIIMSNLRNGHVAISPAP